MNMNIQALKSVALHIDTEHKIAVAPKVALKILITFQ
jgi:hypothetical protein